MALTLKYRPKCFAELIGQPTIVSVLSRQIATKSWKNVYLFCGPAGCGKTTTARIVANEINGGQGEPIEIDGASNNGVDNIRALISDAQQSSIDCDYKVYIIDECVTGDTEILTNEGYKTISSLTKNELIAQYTDDGNIEFVKPTEYVEMPYNGEIYSWQPRHGHTVRMTPNHVQPLYYTKSGKIKEFYMKDITFAQSNNIIVSGNANGSKTHLTAMDKIVILCQADATLNRECKDHNNWIISLTRERKIKRFIEIFNEASIPFERIKSKRNNVVRFSFSLPKNITKRLSDYFNFNMSSECCKEFIEEVSMWDGSHFGKEGIYYSCIDKSNTDFVSAVGTLCGYSCNQVVQEDERSTSYSNVHRVFMTKAHYHNCKQIKNTTKTEMFDGTVYCVKVPSKKIVIRADGYTFITGNCHQLTRAAWDASLKLIEEPPLNSIFIFCTTNPDKIPDTILSRVQRFDFLRVPKNVISDRLEYIMNEEVHKDYEKSALDRIASMADGHVRDAIQLLDKCLDMSESVTLDNVEAILGLVKYDALVEIITNLFSRNLDGALKELDAIKSYNTDISSVYDSFIGIAIDCAIYAQTGNFSYTNIPEGFKTVLKADKELTSSIVSRLMEFRKYLNQYNAETFLKTIFIEICKG